MDRKGPRLMRARPLAPTAEAEVGRLGQSPTSRHHSFKVTATPEALPMMLELAVDLFGWRWWLLGRFDSTWIGLFGPLNSDDWILRIVFLRFISGRAVLTA